MVGVGVRVRVSRGDGWGEAPFIGDIPHLVSILQLGEHHLGLGALHRVLGWVG